MRILACGVAVLAAALIAAVPAASGTRNSKPKGTAVVGSNAIKSGQKKANGADWFEPLKKRADSYKKTTRAGVRELNAIDAAQRSLMIEFGELEPTTPEGARKKKKRP
jgi:hypothetical protein